MQEQKDMPVMAQQVAILSESAAELARRGQSADAAQIYQKILELAPYNLPALNFLTTRAFDNNDTDLCLQLLERALQVNPDPSGTHLNIAMVYKARGEHARALAAMDDALQAKPSFAKAALTKAALLEEMGREQDAIAAYARAFNLSPVLRRSRQDPERVLPQLREPAARGDALITRTMLGLIDAALAPIRAGCSAEELQRVDAFVDIYIGRSLPKYAHAAQRPTFLYFPGLEPQPFFEREAFDWYGGLEAAAEEIRAELLAVLQEPEQLKPYVDLSVPDPGQWAGLNRSLQWSSFHLYKAGQRVEENCRRCPATLAAVEKLPLPRNATHSPEAFFSILKPGTHIPPHFGLGNYKLATHLALIVPADCAIRVGNETRNWEAGRCLTFDDSFRHEAWNNSGELRAVLILDTWNPQLSELERSAVSAVFGAMQEFERVYGSPATRLTSPVQA